MRAHPRRVTLVCALLLVVMAAGASLSSVAVLGGCGHDDGRQTLRLLYAGSVIVPFESLAREFERRNPGLRVTTESHGSVQCIRQITELGRRFDLLVSADYSLVPPMMFDVDDEKSGLPYARWQVLFATNRLVLAYSEKSRHADEITQDNWYEVVARPGVRFGIADPRFDAAGYRTLMVLQLAEHHYGDPIIFENLTLGRLAPPVVTERDGADDVILVPELLATTPDGGLVLRGSSVQLLPLLESGDVDYAIEYESVARQRGLEYLELPPQIDLSDAAHEDLYRHVVVRIDMQRFKTVKPEFRGEVIAYGMTVPVNAPNADAGRRFTAFLLSDEGRRILAEHHQPLIEPPTAQNADRLPASLRRLVAVPDAAGGTAP